MCLLLEEREGKSEVKLAMTIICFDTFGVNNYLLCITLIDIGAKSTLHHLFVDQTFWDPLLLSWKVFHINNSRSRIIFVSINFINNVEGKNLLSALLNEKLNHVLNYKQIFLNKFCRRSFYATSPFTVNDHSAVQFAISMQVHKVPDDFRLELPSDISLDVVICTGSACGPPSASDVPVDRLSLLCCCARRVDFCINVSSAHY